MTARSLADLDALLSRTGFSGRCFRVQNDGVAVAFVGGERLVEVALEVGDDELADVPSDLTADSRPAA